MSAPQITVLVCDAEALFADALARALMRRSDLSVVGELPSSAGEAIDAIALHDPDVALVDFWLPGGQATEVVRYAGEIGARTRIVVLSSLIATRHIQEIVAAGAAGLLPKGATLMQAVDAIRRAHAGEPLVYGDDLATLFARIDAQEVDVEFALARVRGLTERQLDVLSLLERGHGPEEVARRLGIAPGTVKVHIHRILSETGTSSATEAVAVARYCGVLRTSGWV